MVPSSIPESPSQRTSASYIYWPGAPDPWWIVLVARAPEPEPSFVYFPPPAAPEPRRTPMARADVYASLLQAAEYLDASQNALRDGADASVLDALGVLSGIVAVVTGQLRGSCLPNTSAETMQ